MQSPFYMALISFLTGFIIGVFIGMKIDEAGERIEAQEKRIIEEEKLDS
jgi:uncharacterized protein YneF (UPF0154 family)